MSFVDYLALGLLALIATCLVLLVVGRRDCSDRVEQARQQGSRDMITAFKLAKEALKENESES